MTKKKLHPKILKIEKVLLENIRNAVMFSNPEWPKGGHTPPDPPNLEGVPGITPECAGWAAAALIVPGGSVLFGSQVANSCGGGGGK